MDDTEARIRELLLEIRDTEQRLEGLRAQAERIIREPARTAAGGMHPNLASGNGFDLFGLRVSTRPRTQSLLRSLGGCGRAFGKAMGVFAAYH